MENIKLILALVFSLSFSGVSSGNSSGDTLATDTVKNTGFGNDMIFTNKIDKMPVFNAGPNIDFRIWLHFELNRAEVAERCPSGWQINVQFTVTSSGKIEDVYITNNARPIFSNPNNYLSVSCINSIIKIFKDSEQYWIPGSHNGKEVSVGFSIPITLR
jgi:hypothetical protein